MALWNDNCFSSALCGVNAACVFQIPPSEVMIQPAPFAMTIPGPILSASCEPVVVAPYTPYGMGYSNYSGWPYGAYGYGRRYGSWASSPCYSGRSRICRTYECNPCRPC